MTATMLRYSNMNNAEAFSNLLLLPIDFALSGGNVVIPSVVGKAITVYRIFLIVGGDTNLTMQDGPSTAQSGALPMLANGTLAFDISNIPWYQTSVGKDFVITSSNAVQVSGTIYFQQN